MLLSGCTTTQTTSQIISDDTIKAMITAVDKLDKEQVKKLETAIKEKLKDESNTDIGSGQTSTVGSSSETELHEVSPVVETGETKTEELNKAEDTSKVSALKWTNKGDPHHITQCYFGHGHDSELFKMIAQLPIDFTCTLDNGGVTISCPASDDTGRMAMYEGDHMQKRRAFVCLFDADKNLVDCQDFAESFHLDSRWKNKGAVKCLVVHCKRGNAVSRTALNEVR